MSGNCGRRLRKLMTWIDAKGINREYADETENGVSLRLRFFCLSTNVDSVEFTLSHT